MEKEEKQKIFGQEESSTDYKKHFEEYSFEYEKASIDLESITGSIFDYEEIKFGNLCNDKLAYYYREMAAIAEDNGNYLDSSYYTNKATYLEECHRLFHFDYYDWQAIKDFQKTKYCMNRFCVNCAKKSAATKFMRFKEVFDKQADQYDTYHVVLTAKSCIGDNLKIHLNNMLRCFQKFVRYLSGRDKIFGIDFSRFGYAGIVRNLEINPNLNEKYKVMFYHAHFHCILAVKKGTQFKSTGEFGKNYNSFSWNKFTEVRTPFSDFEILIQKIWYMIINNHTVILNPPKNNSEALSILTLQEGYSAVCEEIKDGNYHEAFKYTIKPNTDVDMNFDTFKHLHEALFKKRASQGYGIFYRLKLDDKIDDSFDSIHDGVIYLLKKFEEPTFVSETAEQVIENMKKNIRYINRKKWRAIIQKQGLGQFNFLFDTIEEDKKKIALEEKQLAAMHESQQKKDLEDLYEQYPYNKSIKQELREFNQKTFDKDRQELLEKFAETINKTVQLVMELA